MRCLELIILATNIFSNNGHTMTICRYQCDNAVGINVIMP